MTKKKTVKKVVVKKVAKKVSINQMEILNVVDAAREMFRKGDLWCRFGGGTISKLCPCSACFLRRNLEVLDG